MTCQGRVVLRILKCVGGGGADWEEIKQKNNLISAYFRNRGIQKASPLNSQRRMNFVISDGISA